MDNLHGSEQDGQTAVVTIAEEGADDQRLDDLARLLRSDLLGVVDDVRPAASGAPAPPGTRGLGVTEIGALVVAVKGSVDTVSMLVTAIRSWLGRSSTPRSVEITVAGNSLKLSSISDEEQKALVEQFLTAVRQQG
jgi:hypothetical protein